MKVLQLKDEEIIFEDGTKLYSHHDQDCCESHYLDFTHTKLEDFEGLNFDLSNEDFFERVPDYGIRLKPTNGLPVAIPGYGYNNGYYTENLSLVVKFTDGSRKHYDITDCQVVQD
jgi:hypothetical protein